MSQGYGIEPPGVHRHTEHRPRTRYLVIIDAGGSAIARLFLENREPVTEFDAGTEEVAQMTQGLTPSKAAAAAEWDRALDGHSAEERAAADVYTLDL